MKISTADLAAITSKLMAHLIVARNVQEIQMPVDEYWQIPEHLMYNSNLTAEMLSNQLEVGSISDEYELLEKFVLQGDSPLISNFRELGHVMICIAQALETDVAKYGG